MKKIIEPSLLSLLHKSQNEAITYLKTISQLGLKYVHYDVMDGQFVPNKALDCQFFNELKQLKLKPTIHLMVNDPQPYLDKYFKYDIEVITFHIEPLDLETIKKHLLLIKNHGFKCGIAIKMETDLNNYESIFSLLDYITIMSVNPGKSGQKYDDRCQHNLKTIFKFKQTNKPHLVIQLDGGVNLEVAKQNYQYVDNFVMGSYFFGNIENMPKIIKQIKENQF